MQGSAKTKPFTIVTKKKNSCAWCVSWSYLGNEDHNDAVVFFNLTELWHQRAQSVCQIGVHLPLHAGHAHHYRHWKTDRTLGHSGAETTKPHWAGYTLHRKRASLLNSSRHPACDPSSTSWTCEGKHETRWKPNAERNKLKARLIESERQNKAMQSVAGKCPGAAAFSLHDKPAYINENKWDAFMHFKYSRTFA